MRGIRRLTTGVAMAGAAAVAVLAGACAPETPAPAPSEFASTVADLAATGATFCSDAQQRLTGLDDTTMPLSSIENVVHTDYSTFVSSKASLVPLQTQSWSMAEPVADPAGGTVSVTHRISCKTRSSDHLATAGFPTAPDLECRALNERSIALAWDRLTAGQRDAYEDAGRAVVLGSDRLFFTGPEWLTATGDETVDAGGLHVAASALRIDFTDPAYASFPETVRGVHYCTVWSPEWAYAWFRVGAFGA